MSDASLVVKPDMVWKRWKDNMHLLNVVNIWDGMVEGEIVKSPRERITRDGTGERATRQMKSGKAGGLTQLVDVIICAAGKARAKKMTKSCDMIVDERKVLGDWELSTFIPINNEKGDPLECES